MNQSTSKLVFGAYLPERSALFGAVVPSLDGTDLDALIVLCDNQKPIILDGVEWGCYGKKIPGANSETDGVANTKAMADAGSALGAQALRLNAALPSFRELVALWAASSQFIGDGWYWSSTQCSASTAWYQLFDSGYTGWDGKYGKLRAVVVRRVSLHSVLQSFGQ